MRHGEAGKSGRKDSVLRKPTAEELLRANGLRPTSTRRRILDVLLRAKKPLSHQAVMDRLGQQPIDRVTVYRTLHRLVETGLVHEAFVNDRTGLYETADRCYVDHCHAHFTCRRCGQTVCLTEAKVPLVTGLRRGFVAQRQKVLIEGLCPRCSGGHR